MMRRWIRTAGKWTVRGLLLLVLLVAIDIAILAFPNVLFAHKQTFDEFTVYSNQPLPGGYGQVIDGVRERIEAMENARPGADCRVYVCDSQRLFSFFAFLTRRSSDSMAICLSAFNSVYMNEEKIGRIAAHNYGGIRHCRFEGDYAEVIAHEIVHINVVKSAGYWKAIKMPFWKSEGYAEYQANIAPARADSSYFFTDRIDLLMDTAFWGGDESIARRLYEWHILVEYLAEEKGYGLEELYDETVTELSTRREMLAWYDERRAQR